jgi:hypothetical protein
VPRRHPLTVNWPCVAPSVAPWPVQLDFKVGDIKPISESHSLILLCRGPIQLYKYLYGGAPYKSPKIAENRAACLRRRLRYISIVRPRARRTHIDYRQKSLDRRKKRRLRRISEVQPDLRGSLIVPPNVKSSCAGPSLRASPSIAMRYRKRLSRRRCVQGANTVPRCPASIYVASYTSKVIVNPGTTLTKTAVKL